MYDFRKYMRFHPRLMLSPQSRQQFKYLSPAINPIDSAEPCFTHDNVVASHLCGECMKSNDLNVGLKLLSIWWLIEQICSLTKECQVYQFVPNTSTPRQFVSILLTVHFLEMVIIPGRTRDYQLLPCRKTTRPSLREVSHTLAIFQLLQQKFVIRAFCTFQSWFRSVYIHVERTPNIFGIEKWCWFLKVHVFHQFLPHGSHIRLYSSHFYHINVYR